MYGIAIADTGKIVRCSGGQTLLRALAAAGIVLEANCGGKGTCGKCKVEILRGRVTHSNGVPLSAAADNTCPACQVYLCEDITLALKSAAASEKGSMTAIPADDGQPLLRKTVLVPEYPTLEDCHSLQEMLGRAIDGAEPVTDGGIVGQLAEIAAGKPSRITAVILDNTVIALEPGDTTGALFGVAFDIGTTTVAGMLVDVNDRKIIAAQSETNPQAVFGADVISRIEAAATPGGLETLATVIRRCLNEIIVSLCRTAAIPRQQVYAAVIAGNTAMGHLLMGISPQSLAAKPFAAAFKKLGPFPPGLIGLDINRSGRVIMLPNIASFIGADTTAAIVATGQDNAAAPTLLVDLGTNGEIVLGDGNRLWACSTAAGPAFEGAHIRDGIRATAGAIDDVTIGKTVRIRTIGGGRPAGICGSGLVKAVAELIKCGIVTASGRFNPAARKDLPPEVAGRLRMNAGRWEYILAKAADSASGRAIAVTQDDIRQLQLVKAAIRSGIEILMDKAGHKHMPQVLLAGAFGNYIDKHSELIIALFPLKTRERISSVGNAAGTGAVHVLLSREKLARCRRVASGVTYMELAAQANFQKMFLANLSFTEVHYEKQ